MTYRLSFFIILGLFLNIEASPQGFSYFFEKARYLYEIEANAQEALKSLKVAETKALGIEKDRIWQLRAEILYSLGSHQKARQLLSQEVSQSQLKLNYLRSSLHLIGMDTLPQRMLLSTKNIGPNDSLFLSENRILRTDGHGKWAPLGQSIESYPSLLGEKLALWNQGLFYSLEPNSKTLWIQDEHGQEIGSFDFNKSVMWSQYKKSLSLFWTADGLYAFKKGKFTWQWHAQNRWCTPAQNQDSLSLLLLCPTTNQLVQIKPQKDQVKEFKLHIKTFGAFELDQSMIIYDEEGIRRYDPQKKKNIWQNNCGPVLESYPIGNEIILRTKNQMMLIKSQNGALIKSQNQNTEHLAVFANRILLWQNKGLIKVYDSHLDSLWEYRTGAEIQQAPFIVNHKLYLPLRNQTLMELNWQYNGIQPSIQTEFFHKAEQMLAVQNAKEAQKWIRKVLEAEPGHLGAKLFKITTPLQAPSLQSIYADYLQGREDPIFKAKTLKSMSQIDGALWTQDLDQEYTAFPLFHQFRDRIWWVHPENTLLNSMDYLSGEIQHYPKTNSYPGLIQPFDMNGSLIAVAIGKRIDYFNGLGQYRYSSQDLPETPLWVGVFPHHVIRVGRSGSLTYLDYNGNVQAFLPSGDRSVVIQIQRNKGILDLFYRSGLWLRTIGQNRQWVKRKLESGIESACATEEQVVISTSGHNLIAYDFTGKESWRVEIPSQIISMQSTSGQIIVGYSNQKLAAFSSHTGEKIWEFQGHASLFVKPLIVGQIMYLDQGNELWVISTSTGQLIRKKTYPFRIGSIQYLANRILVTSATGLVFAYALDQI